MSKRAKFLLGIGVIAALIVGWQVAAFAVHQETFQLEGDAVDNAANPPDDWQNVVNHTQTGTGAGDTAFVSEPNPQSTFFTGGGSKDPNAIGQWQWKDDTGGIPDKTNLTNSFAAAYNDNGQKLLYFGADRFDGSGDAAIAFWFFQDPVATTGTSSGGFSGAHRNNDVLVISNFSNGGVVPTITVYKWDTSCTKASGPTPGNGDCGAANLRIAATSNDANCDSPTPDTACAIVNDANDVNTVPWDFTDKDGNHNFLPGEFFEGGIDLTALGLGNTCFSTALAETRTSTSPTSTLKDFTLGSFGKCGSTTKTTPKDNAGNNIPAGGLTIGTDGTVKVKDSADITVTGGSPTWSGTVSFFLCKVDSPGLCTTGGTTINDGTTAKTVTNAAPTAVSDAATVTSAGRYCWRAVFSGDSAAGVTGSSDSSATECFTVNPVTPTLTTNASADVNLGSKVSDTATLSGTANKPGTPVINPTTPGGKAGGTITFNLYGPDDATCSGNPVYTKTGVAVSGDGTYSSGNFTPTQPGTYRWVATYSGDLPNTNAKAGACNDANENVTVTSVKSSMSSAQSFIPNDSATISAPAGGNLAGTVTFKLFASSDCGAAGQDAAIYTQNVAVSGASPQTVNTTNTTTNVLTATTPLSWQLTYDSTNPAQEDISAKCTETSDLTIDNGTTQTSP